MANERSESYREKNEARKLAVSFPQGKAARKARRERRDGAFGRLDPKSEEFQKLVVGTRGDVHGKAKSNGKKAKDA